MQTPVEEKKALETEIVIEDSPEPVVSTEVTAGDLLDMTVPVQEDAPVTSVDLLNNAVIEENPQ